METKQCRQCGDIKPLTQFRPYYNGSGGTYKICKDCEKLNSRVKYLERKGDKATEADKKDLALLYQIYELQRACGLKPPQRRRDASSKLQSIVDALEVQASAKQSAPDELLMWLTADLTGSPEYYLDTVYEQLKAKYRPLLRIDNETLEPVYDNTHFETLDKILGRFMDYEDEYYQED